MHSKWGFSSQMNLRKLICVLFVDMGHAHKCCGFHQKEGKLYC
jgi:hypothetical protein